ncbi:MAG: signal peptidase I [Acidobacteria bacterium]|nr:signal peptidase I [Acidobacteriota bacterium]
MNDEDLNLSDEGTGERLEVANPESQDAQPDLTSASGTQSEATLVSGPFNAPRFPAYVTTKRPTEAGDWLSGIQWLCSTVVLAIFVITFIVQAFQIPSESMENTLLIGDYLLVDKVHYGPTGALKGLMPYSDIHRGDVIVFRYPVHPTQHFVKRVIGVPGDHIHLFRGTVFVNDKPLDDSTFAVHKAHNFDSYRDNFPAGNYISPEVNSSWWVEMHNVVHQGEIVVPPDDYFVLGDNRDESLDSRYWGFVPRENIIGRPLVIYWSVQRRESADSDGRLERLLYTLVHLPEDARWDRTLRLVR